MREGGVSGAESEALAAAAMDAHVGLADPHAQYQLESEKGGVSGYAGLGADGRLPAGQSPLKSVYATGGNQALAPADIGAVVSTRQVATGKGLTGGGDLSADRTVTIAAFGGLLAADFDPDAQLYVKNAVTTIKTFDVGADGQLIPTGFQLPAADGGGLLRPQIAFELDNGAVVTVNNNNVGATLQNHLQGISNTLMGDAFAGVAAQNGGRAVRKVRFEVNNTDVVNDYNVDLGTFRIRAYCLPLGAGAVTVTP